MDYIAKANRYIDAVLSGVKLANKWEILACKRQLKDLSRQDDPDFEYYFDSKAGEKPCKFIELLEHVKGEKAGENIKLEDWQVFIYTTIFGWLNKKTGKRRFNKAYIESPRGNGKSTMLSCTGLFMEVADGEKGADVYSFATTRDQARIVFDDALAMARGNKDLRDYYGITCLNHAIIVLGTNSKFQPKSADANTLDGLNTHCAIIDELHAHKTREVYDVVNTSIGKRAQPLLFCITTAGVILDGICMEQHKLLEHILEGDIVDDSFFGIIYTIDEGDDWQDINSAIKANPNWNVSVNPKIIISKLAEAKISADAERNYKTKHLDVWCNADTQWLKMSYFDKCVQDIRPEDFTGYPCIYGIDLASKLDMACVMKLFWKPDEKGVIHYYVFGDYWLPEKALTENKKNTFYSNWKRDGLLHVTPGAINDLGEMERFVAEDATKYMALCIGYDPFQATQMAGNLAMLGLEMSEVGATVKNLSEPMKSTQALIYANRIHFSKYDPIIRWMFSNVVCHSDSKENIFPRKERPENKIDGAVATIMAMRMAIFKDVENNYAGYNYFMDFSMLAI